MHEWTTNTLYHSCAHDPLSEDEQRERKWLTPGSSAHTALRKVVMETRLVKDIVKTTRAVHTGPLESFHSLINKYCSKRQHFCFKGMLARTQLAVLDHNSNLLRDQAVDKEGNPRFALCFPKRTK